MPAARPSGPSTLIKDHLAGGASRLAALLLPQILPVFSVVAPCHPGAALWNLVLVQPIQATSPPAPRPTARRSPRTSCGSCRSAPDAAGASGSAAARDRSDRP